MACVEYPRMYPFLTPRTSHAEPVVPVRVMPHCRYCPAYCPLVGKYAENGMFGSSPFGARREPDIEVYDPTFTVFRVVATAPTLKVKKWASFAVVAEFMIPMPEDNQLDPVAVVPPEVQTE